jgi:hypothetical protein
MADTLSDPQKKDFHSITQKTYKDQACFFLNAFWKEFESKAEDIWRNYKKFLDLDRQQYNGLPKEKRPTETYVEMNSLDEFWSHKYLETYGKTLTAIEFRNEFKKIDANFDKRMSFLEFLVWEYQLSIKELMLRPQGADAGEILKAQELLNQVATAFTEAQRALDQATTTEAAAQQAEKAAVASELKAKSAAEDAKKTEEAAKNAAAVAAKAADEALARANAAAAAAREQQAAVDDLKSQEDAHAAKTKELEAKAEAGGVAGMRAKNELAQHKAEDPLPLRKAKLNAQAAAKKTEKAKQDAADSAAIAEKSKQAALTAANSAEKDRIKAEEAAAHAAHLRTAAQHATEAAKQDRLRAEEAVREAQRKLEEAEAYLEEQKRKGSGDKKGYFWWLDRELRERKEYMPKTGSAKLLF